MKAFFDKCKQLFRKISAKPGAKSFGASLIAILLGLLVGFLVMVITNPLRSPRGLLTMLTGFFGHPRGAFIGFGELLARATPMIFTGLAIAFAFKTGLFNIGASGQYTIGLFAAMVVGLIGDPLGVFQWPVAVLAGALAGGLWGAIPGFFKSHLNVHEVITGIMFNYIGLYLVNGIITGVGKTVLLNGTTYRTKNIDQSARTPYFFMDKIFKNSGLDFSIFIAITACVVIYFILKKTVFGRELKSVGNNPFASKYAGINEKKSLIMSMAISGLLAGLGGALFILSPSTRNLGNTYSPENTILPAGFDGIPVALLANLNPLGVIASALFLQYIEMGGSYLQTIGYKPEIVDIIIGVILYFSAFALIVGRFLGQALKKKKKTENLKIPEEGVSL
jgi:ABC-type uncharacterized transport system permease subunit